MPNYKVTFFFNYAQLNPPVVTLSAGWTETYYLVSASFAAARTSTLNLMTKRAKLLTTGATLFSARISDDAVQGDATIVNGNVNDPIDKTQAIDTPWQAYGVTLRSTFLYRRPLYIRGLPDVIFAANFSADDGDFRAAWNKALTTFLNALKAEPWCIKVKLRGADAPRTPVAVINFAVPNITITTTAPSGIAAGQKFTLYNYRPNPQLNGVHTAGSVGPNTITFQSLISNLGFYTSGATVAKVLVAYLPIDDYSLEGVTKRNTGRPFGAHRGRRRLPAK